MRGRILAVLMAFVGVVAVAAPARAAAPVTCYSGYACLNDGGAYGHRYFLDSPSGGYGCKYVQPNVVDWGSNESTHNLKVYDGSNCTGSTSYLYAGTTGDLGGWDNRINSVQFV